MALKKRGLGRGLDALLGAQTKQRDSESELLDTQADKVSVPPNSSSETFGRSEEHTSELQSHHDLVCRLLLEKKKHLPYVIHLKTVRLFGDEAYIGW